MPDARIIEIISPWQTEKRAIGRENPAPLPNAMWRPVCKENAPILFFVNQEARGEVMKEYMAFRGTQPKSPVVFVDFRKDWLAFNGKRFDTDVAWGRALYGCGYSDNGDPG
jgi:hypothetical protein